MPAELRNESMRERLSCFWFSTPNETLAAIVARAGFKRAILDCEHGPMDAMALYRFIPYCKALGMEIMVKVSVAERHPVQSALDFGADGVMIPHLKDLAHARAATSYAKYPPLGDRSVGVAPHSGFARFADDHVARANRETLCYAMIETPEAFAAVDEIAGLPTVDGIFPGMADLMMRQGRGRPKSTGSTADYAADLERIAQATRRHGKLFVLSAKGPDERRRAIELGADIVCAMPEYTLLQEAVAQLRATLDREAPA